MKKDTIEWMCEDFLRTQRKLLDIGDTDALSTRTIKEYEYSLRHITAQFGAWSPKAFKPTHGAQFLLKMKMERRGTAGNRAMAALASAFNHGLALGMVNENPCRGIRRNRERPRTRKVEIGEVNALSAVAESMGEAYLMTACIALTVALTGRRRGDILRLQAMQMNADGIFIIESKTRRHGERHVRVQWSPTLRAVIDRALSIHGDRRGLGFIFQSSRGEPYTDSGFKSNWTRLMAAYAKQHGERFRAHDLRALYVTEMLDQGRAPNTHSNDATMRRVYDRRKVIDVTPLA